ncbi:MAG: hypothetical protein LH472_07650, partial [Pyrinomonadaceae bacterium]|nr:hypothetical protein [Pyrinomonadaceae bacterium]
YLAVSMRLKPLNDLAAIENGLNEFKNNHPELNGAEVIFGIINSGIDASQPIFAGRIHGIWDQTLTENNADGQIYGKFLIGDSLTECTDADGNGTRTAKLVADFAAQFGGAMENIVVVKTNFQNAHLADAVKYIFETAQSSGKTAIVNLNLDDFFDVRKDADDFSNFIGQEISAEKIVIPIVGNNAERKIWATAVIASNKFSPAKFKFVVPSNSQPGSPPEVVLRGWFESSGDCEITIFSPNGGVTRSTQPATIEGNPTRFGIYTNSQAFLTKPSISPAPNGRREFFIDLQPIPPVQFVVGGVWKLTVTNVGNAEVTVSVLSWSPEKAKDVVFI